MTHEEAFALMMDALDGVLSPAGKKALDGHLALCQDCYAEWHSLQLVDKMLASAQAIPAPVGFGQRVQAKLEVPSWRRTLGALFALSLGSVFALLLISAPSAVALWGIWMVYNDPASFASLLIWLNQLLGVSGTLLGAGWTTVSLLIGELVSSPVTLIWTLAAALTVALWAHIARRPALVTMRTHNG